MHTGKTDPISLGNAKADVAAKEAAVQEMLTSSDTPSYIDETVLKDMQDVSPKSEKT